MGSPEKKWAQLFDLRHPFFNPVWRRVAMTLFIGVWAIVEFVNGTPTWGAIFAALAVWCTWTFFVTWNGPIEDTDNTQ